uniref:Uncharacterized protein n=1 Tax=Octopus bimaculoides TaxID=37653 RepID=A0A0L8HFC5_OCTBM
MFKDFAAFHIYKVLITHPYLLFSFIYLFIYCRFYFILHIDDDEFLFQTARQKILIGMEVTNVMWSLLTYHHLILHFSFFFLSAHLSMLSIHPHQSPHLN